MLGRDGRPIRMSKRAKLSFENRSPKSKTSSLMPSLTSGPARYCSRQKTSGGLEHHLEHHRRHGIGGLRAAQPALPPALALPTAADPAPAWCSAKTRRGTSCRRKGTGRGGRCRLHGGKSTGPKTQEGLDRIAAAQRKRWQRWRAANPRIIPAISRRHELRLLKVFNQNQHAKKKPGEEPAKQVPQAYEARLTRHAQREAENALGRELAAMHQEKGSSSPSGRSGTLASDADSVDGLAA